MTGVAKHRFLRCGGVDAPTTVGYGFETLAMPVIARLRVANRAAGSLPPLYPESCFPSASPQTDSFSAGC